MTAKKLALLHTSAVLAPLFASLCAKWMPEARIFHMVDESLIKNTIQAGHLQKLTIRRLIAMIESGFDAGADAMLVTCSSIGPGVEIAQMLFDLPVIRVDEAMAILRFLIRLHALPPPRCRVLDPRPDARLRLDGRFRPAQAALFLREPPLQEFRPQQRQRRASRKPWPRG